jgi:hypothetical protein
VRRDFWKWSPWRIVDMWSATRKLLCPATTLPVTSASSASCKWGVGASGEIRTLKTPVFKTGCYSNSHTLALWCTGEDLNLRVLQRGSRVTAGPFQPGSCTCANLAEGRRIERPSLITMPWFSSPVAGHSTVPSAVGGDRRSRVARIETPEELSEWKIKSLRNCSACFNDQ